LIGSAAETDFLLESNYIDRHYIEDHSISLLARISFLLYAKTTVGGLHFFSQKQSEVRAAAIREILEAGRSKGQKAHTKRGL
jgi:hypothetical protein